MIRLSRKPSLWAGFLGHFAFAAVWIGMASLVNYLAITRPTPWLAYVFLALFDLLTLAVAWDIVVRFWRALTGKQPVVEIDRDSLELGSVAQVRVTESHPESVYAIAVKLIAYHRIVSQDGYAKVSSYEPCYNEVLLQTELDASVPFTRTIPVRIPSDPPDPAADWTIAVNTTLRQGGIIAHEFPINVRKLRPSA